MEDLMEDAFSDALDRVNLLPEQPTHVQLNLYGLFKQARCGDISGSRPGVFDVRGRAKYDAWASRKGMTQEDAMMTYIESAEDLGA